MAQVIGLLGGAALVVGALVALLAVRVYRSFPAVFPREETALGPQTYAAVRLGVVAGGTVGVLGAWLAVIDTLGTFAATSPGESGVLVEIAGAIPEWIAATGPLAGAALLAASGLLTLTAALRAWLADRG